MSEPLSSAAQAATTQLPREHARRYGFVGIIVPHHAQHGPAIQAILSDHAHLVQGRMGLPHLENDTLAVITLIVHGTTDELGSLTGRLGRLPGVIVKSGLAPLGGDAVPKGEAPEAGNRGPGHPGSGCHPGAPL